MRRILATVALLALFVTPALAALNPYTYLKSVAVLQTEGRNMCSVTAINAEKDYFLTAAHCVVAHFPTAESPEVDEQANTNMTVDGLPATILDVNVLQDLAVLYVPGSKRPALKIAHRDVRYLDAITMAGHPFGWDAATVMRGTVAAPSLQFTNNPNDYPFTKLYMILQVSGAPGNSGSSVVNDKMEVVSVVQISWGRSFESVMGTAPYFELVRFASRYFGK